MLIQGSAAECVVYGSLKSLWTVEGQKSNQEASVMNREFHIAVCLYNLESIDGCKHHNSEAFLNFPSDLQNLQSVRTDHSIEMQLLLQKVRNPEMTNC